jgi:hypothetical protein
VNRLHSLAWLRTRARGTEWERRPCCNPAALVRAVWWLFVRGYESEICYDCGRPVATVWWAEGSLWSRLTGWGEGGLLCMGCFARRAGRQSVALNWSARASRRR